MTKKLLYIGALLLSIGSNQLQAQDQIKTNAAANYVTIDSNLYTAEELIKNVLIKDPCMSVSNVSSSASCGIGYFNRGTSNFPFKQGMVIRTGVAKITEGQWTNNPSGISTVCSNIHDSDLYAINSAFGNTFAIKDASYLKFSFIAGTSDFSFRYLFASNEYGTYQCGYGDAFAFILKDETAGTPAQNLAVVPGTNTPISITSVRDYQYNTGCSSVNAAYFDLYNYADPSKSTINMKGQTKVMTATAPVVPGHTYSVKLVIGDYRDTAYDSAVFIEAASFTSGPPECLDKIKLLAFTDSNANGIKDSGEKEFTDGSFLLKKNNIAPATSISASAGTYTLYDNDPTNVYDINFEISPEYAKYYSAAAINFTNMNIAAGSGTQTLNFPISVTQTYKDVSVNVIPLGDPVPGSTYVNKIAYKNTGTISSSGFITFVKPTNSTVTSISQPGTVSNANGFTYNFSPLAPNETRTIDVTMSLPLNVNIGEVLTSTATISTLADKWVMSSKTSANSQTIVPSNASSRITESRPEKIPFNSFTTDDYLTYTIRFQNTGTANATSVRVEDMLDSKIDVKSIRMADASHKYVMEQLGNKLVWKMDYINLVGAPQSQELSKGYISFRAKLLPGFAPGDIIPNSASIYFDSNDPIITNTHSTEFTGTLSTETFESENVQLFPNPASEIVQVQLQNSIETLDSIMVYDLSGKLVQKVSAIAANQSSFFVGSLSKGIYLVEITTAGKMKATKKLIVK